MNKYIEDLKNNKDPHSVVMDLLSHKIKCVDDNYYTVQDFIESDSEYCNDTLLERILQHKISGKSIQEHLNESGFKF